MSCLPLRDESSGEVYELPWYPSVRDRYDYPFFAWFAHSLNLASVDPAVRSGLGCVCLGLALVLNQNTPYALSSTRLAATLDDTKLSSSLNPCPPFISVREHTKAR